MNTTQIGQCTYFQYTESKQTYMCMSKIIIIIIKIISRNVSFVAAVVFFPNTICIPPVKA